MIDMWFLAFISACILATALIFGTAVVFTGGIDRMQSGRPYGRLMFWGGGALLATIVGGILGILLTNLPTTLVLIAVLALVIWTIGFISVIRGRSN